MTFLSRLFLLSDVACLPLLSLLDAIPNLTSWHLLETPFSGLRPKLRPPPLHVHNILFILSTMWWTDVSHLRDGAFWKPVEAISYFFFCYCLVLSRCCRIELGHTAHKQEVTWSGSWDKSSGRGLELRSPDSLGSELFLMHLSFARPEFGSPLGLLSNLARFMSGSWIPSYCVLTPVNPRGERRPIRTAPMVLSPLTPPLALREN